MPKHTSGPWIYDPNDRQDLQIKSKVGAHIAEVTDNRVFSLEQCQANAALIASAPEMYDILKRVECIVYIAAAGTSLALEFAQLMKKIDG